MAEGDQFYEQNEQCWRCRMYVPRVEMKYHAGMLYCPICYQDVAESGGRCQLCGNHISYGAGQLCRECRERKNMRRCTKCGSELDASGTCPRCSRGDSGGSPKSHSGSGVVICSSCHSATEHEAWRGGQPYCPSCTDKRDSSISQVIARKIGGFVNSFIKEKQGERIRVKVGEGAKKRDRKGEQAEDKGESDAGKEQGREETGDSAGN